MTDIITELTFNSTSNQIKITCDKKYDEIFEENWENAENRVNDILEGQDYSIKRLNLTLVKKCPLIQLKSVDELVIFTCRMYRDDVEMDGLQLFLDYLPPNIAKISVVFIAKISFFEALKTMKYIYFQSLELGDLQLLELKNADYMDISSKKLTNNGVNQFLKSRIVENKAIKFRFVYPGIKKLELIEGLEIQKEDDRNVKLSFGDNKLIVSLDIGEYVLMGKIE